MRKYFQYLPHLLGLTLVIGATYYIYLHYHYQPQPIEIIYDNIFLDEEVESGQSINIAGAVNQPGEYLMLPGSTWQDLIIEAGGLAIEADLSGLNLGQLIESHSIYIPLMESDITVVTTDTIITPETIPNSDLININTASLSQLIDLPGIGEKTATKIIEYRQTTPFDSIDDIMQVSGIGEAKYDSIKDLITI